MLPIATNVECWRSACVSVGYDHDLSPRMVDSVLCARHSSDVASRIQYGQGLLLVYALLDFFITKQLLYSFVSK